MLAVYSTNLLPWYSKKYKELVSAGAKTSHLLLLNGCDHTAPDPLYAPPAFPSNQR
jgi:hypothetical protein